MSAVGMFFCEKYFHSSMLSFTWPILAAKYKPLCWTPRFYSFITTIDVIMRVSVFVYFLVPAELISKQKVLRLVHEVGD